MQSTPDQSKFNLVVRQVYPKKQLSLTKNSQSENCYKKSIKTKLQFSNKILKRVMTETNESRRQESNKKITSDLNLRISSKFLKQNGATLLKLKQLNKSFFTNILNVNSNVLNCSASATSNFQSNRSQQNLFNEVEFNYIKTVNQTRDYCVTQESESEQEDNVLSGAQVMKAMQKLKKDLFLKKRHISKQNLGEIQFCTKKLNQVSEGFQTNALSEIIPSRFQLADFVKGKLLGRGRFGEVHLVKHIHTGFVCAMKTVNKTVLVKQNMVNQFTRELKIHSFLNHPNVCNLYGFFNDTDNFYLLVELSSDGQVYNLLRKQRRLTQSQTSYIVKQVCQGVRYLHSRHVLHRDIKPQNLILENGIVKLCDFGLSVHHNGAARKTVCGTPVYLSPEVVKGQQYDGRTDIWAVGILTYELLVGKIPFRICSERELHKIVDDKIEFPTFIEVSETAKDFIERILKKNPDDRITILELLTHPFINKVDELNYQQLH